MNDLLEVRYISEKKGRGVFAKRDIKKDTIIDVAHVVPLPNKDYKRIRKTILYNYCYIWEDPDHKPEFKNAITLSISQFINHSYNPNVKYLYDYDLKAIEFSAIRDIVKGEEILVNYNALVDNQNPVWFEVEQ